MRVVHHYGQRPEFVLLGGLVPELLCSDSDFMHAGTTDIDVQVNLEIACGSVNTARLEIALRNAEFVPDNERIWRWVADRNGGAAVVKFELLADLDDQPANTELRFDGCQHLGAANLRGTRYAAADIEVRELRARIGGVAHTAEINVTGLAGFLLAKCAAARSRRKPKDWYDIAFVLLHNNAGGPDHAAETVRRVFPTELESVRTTLDDLRANFTDLDSQGTQAYVQQMLVDHPGLDPAQLRADAVLAVDAFCAGVTRPSV
ncbi:MAG: hypothetical protein AB7G23_20680 [Vicinamibacterales bacterium]